jgi:Lar family restriction alleviation protein
MPADLLPCPHCGPGTQIDLWHDDDGLWRVSCGACGSQSGLAKNQDRVIETWNRREGRLLDDDPDLGRLAYEVYWTGEKAIMQDQPYLNIFPWDDGVAPENKQAWRRVASALIAIGQRKD